MPYIPFTEEQKMTANGVELADFLRMRGERLERAGREYKLIYSDGSGRHDSITMSGSRWFDHKNQVGGGAIKFMQYFYNMDFPTAVQELLGYSVEPLQRSPPKMAVHAEKSRNFRLPEANENMHRVYAYLIKQRFINPEIIEYFAKKRTLYEDKEHHNAVFVGVDENGVPKQAHKRSTSTFGKSFRQTVESSDTKYSFAHFGESGKLFIFEAPIDMLSYLTLNPENWQKHSYIAMNGVYENAVLTALKGHLNLKEILICTDNDEGGIDAAERLRDVLSDSGYADIKRILPHNKDFNEDLKQHNGVEFLPAVPHRRLEKYHETVGGLQYLRCRSERLISQISAAFRNGQYRYLAEYAFAGLAFFIGAKDEKAMFEKLKSKLVNEYRAYSDKGRISAKIDSLKSAYSAVYRDLKMPARTYEQSVQTAKNLFILADCTVKICTEEKLCEVQENGETESETSEMSPGERHEVIRY